jgi:16S rRNA (uracil1498-N3)-methyltransferase
MSAHLFSIFIDTDDVATITDQAIIHRLVTVLRFGIGDEWEFFSHTTRFHVRMTNMHKRKALYCDVLHSTPIAPPHTHISLAIGLLKREAMEEAVYNAVQAGATNIIPLITEKSRHKWQAEKELERLHKTALAACEQAKNYTLATIAHPEPLASYVQANTTPLIGFDVTGKPFSELTEQPKEALASATLLIGPEGGFTEAEIAMLSEAGVAWYQMTPTILRSREAVTLAVGSVSALTL